MKKLFLLVLCILSLSLFGNEKFVSNKETSVEEVNPAPQYLYKILSLENWQATQAKKALQLSAEDDAFIHLSTEKQLERIVGKYWAAVPQYVILKIDSSKLKGRLVFEANEGGTNKYYHLYNGLIPFDSIVEAKIVNNPKNK